MRDSIRFEDVERLAEGKDKTAARLIEQVCWDINEAESQIRYKLKWVTETAARVEQTLNEGGFLNELGMFQRVPVELDMAIAARGKSWQMLARLVGEDAANELARR